MVASLLFMVLLLAIAGAYLMTLYNTLKAIAPANRHTPPGTVFIMLIPVVNLVWQFMLYKKIKLSINAEYRSKGVNDTADTTYAIGVVSAIALILSSVVNSMESAGPKLLAGLFSLTGVVLWIIYWVQVSNHKKKIISLPDNTEDSLIFGEKQL